MKKIIFLLIIAFFLAGCTAEWYKHDTVYKTNDHMTFSWWGYNSPDDEDLAKSESEGWWGDEYPYIPAEQLKVAREIDQGERAQFALFYAEKLTNMVFLLYWVYE